MRSTTRLVLAAAALLPAAAWLAPLWQIGLTAPQYPEGLGMFVWIDTITGQKPNDLHSINGLNHYIGMKAIVPDAIPELRMMPGIVLGLIGLGLLAAAVGRRSLLYAWTLAFALVAGAGLVDFYVWGYDYGHDLDPTAAIKVPGLSYQPPIIGSKQLLNFTAHSWPGPAGWALAAALAIGVALCVIEWRRPRQRRLAVALAASVAAGACATPGPAAFHYDADACEHCRMTISDPAFAAQVVTRTGVVHRFDDPACALAFLAERKGAPADVHGVWLNDHAHPDTVVEAGAAVLVASAKWRAPMAGGLAAFASRADAEAAVGQVGGTLVSWAQAGRQAATRAAS
jgi:copper chaperone NosL